MVGSQIAVELSNMRNRSSLQKHEKDGTPVTGSSTSLRSINNISTSPQDKARRERVVRFLILFMSFCSFFIPVGLKFSKLILFICMQVVIGGTNIDFTVTSKQDEFKVCILYLFLIHLEYNVLCFINFYVPQISQQI